MARYLIAKLGVPAVALAAFLFAAPAGLAQHGGHGGGGHGGGGYHGGGVAHGGGGYHGGGAYRGGYGSYGRGYYGGYGRGYYGGYGRGWYGGYYPWWGLGVGWGYPYYSSGYGYYPNDYGYDSGYAYPDSAAPGYYGNYAPNYSTMQAPPAMDNVAQIVVNVPSGAEVWFEGQKMTQSGSVRSFVSPTLPPGKEFVYHVKARWMENGREVEQTRTLDVQAGSRASVNFTAPAPNRS